MVASLNEDELMLDSNVVQDEALNIHGVGLMSSTQDNLFVGDDGVAVVSGPGDYDEGPCRNKEEEEEEEDMVN